MLKYVFGIKFTRDAGSTTGATDATSQPYRSRDDVQPKRGFYQGFRHRIKNINTDDKRILWLVAALIILPFLTCVLGNSEQRMWIVHEDGPVETLSWMGYIVCLLYAFYKGGLGFLRKHWYIHACFAFMCMRELDFDKRFTTMGLLKSKFYVSSTVPPLEHIIGGVFLLILLTMLFLLIRNHLKPFIRGVLALKSFEWSILLSIFLVCFSKTVDGLGRKLRPFGIILTDYQKEIAEVLEEFYELGIPFAFMIALVIYFRNRDAGQGQ